MNIYIMTDLEGISGITSREQVLPEASRYAEGRRLMVNDINVVVRACKEAGAEKVYVRDCHGGGMNVIWSELCEEADGYIIGYTGDDRFPCLDECDAVILLGYHAMAGTPGGTLEHSMSSTSIQNYHINGVQAGEVAIDAGIVGDKGKPVIMVSGDDKVCREAEALLPSAVSHGRAACSCRSKRHMRCCGKRPSKPSATQKPIPTASSRCSTQSRSRCVSSWLSAVFCPRPMQNRT